MSWRTLPGSTDNTWSMRSWADQNSPSSTQSMAAANASVVVSGEKPAETPTKADDAFVAKVETALASLGVKMDH